MVAFHCLGPRGMPAKWETAPALLGFPHVDPSLQTLSAHLPQNLQHVQRLPDIAPEVKRLNLVNNAKLYYNYCYCSIDYVFPFL